MSLLAELPMLDGDSVPDPNPIFDVRKLSKEQRHAMSLRIQIAQDFALPELTYWNDAPCRAHRSWTETYLDPATDDFAERTVRDRPKPGCRDCGIRFRKHQRVGIGWSYMKGRCLIADAVGTGKSAQIAGLVAILKQTGELDEIGRVVIVPRPAALYQWHAELSRMIPFVNVVMVDGAKHTKVKRIEKYREPWDVLLVGPQVLHNDYELLVSHFDFSLLVADDVDALRNRNTKTSVTLKKFGRNCSRMVVVTGTPLQKRIQEMHSVLDPIGGLEIFGSERSFTNRYTRQRPVQIYARGGRKVTKMETVGYCNTPDAPIWMWDGTFKSLDSVHVGDSLMGWESNPDKVKGGGNRIYVESKVLAIQRRVADNVVGVKLSSGATIKCTRDHKWLKVMPCVNEDVWTTVDAKPYRPNHLNDLFRVVDVPRQLDHHEQLSAAWLAGFYDGEGNDDRFSQSLTHNPDTCNRLIRELTVLGLPFGVSSTDGKAAVFFVKGGFQSRVNMLNWLPITRRESLLKLIHTTQFGLTPGSPKRLRRKRDSVLAVIDLPPQEVISMQTTTGNYIAWGLASKNCNVGEFVSKMAPLVLRRTATDIEDVNLPIIMPPNNIYLDLYPAQRAKYTELQAGVLEIMKQSGAEITHIQASTSVHSAAMICGGLSVLGEPDGPGTSVKLDWVEAQLTDGDLSEEKVVVFVRYLNGMRSLAARLSRAGVGNVTISGDDTDKAARAASAQRFWDDPNCRVLIGTTAIEQSLNFQCARHLINIDMIPNPARMEQLVGRIRRDGSAFPHVYVHNLLTVDTHEMRLLPKLEVEQALIDSVWSSSSELFESLSPRQLMQLIIS